MSDHLGLGALGLNLVRKSMEQPPILHGPKPKGLGNLIHTGRIYSKAGAWNSRVCTWARVCCVCVCVWRGWGGVPGNFSPTNSSLSEAGYSPVVLVPGKEFPEKPEESNCDSDLCNTLKCSQILDVFHQPLASSVHPHTLQLPTIPKSRSSCVCPAIHWTS